MDQKDEQVISAYVASKGVLTSSTGVDAVFDVLLAEYGRIAPVLRNKTNASVISAPLDEVAHHRGHIDRIEPREPTGKGVPVIGIVVMLEDADKKYRLIDGHHRLKWCMTNGAPADAVFILLR